MKHFLNYKMIGSLTGAAALVVSGSGLLASASASHQMHSLQATQKYRTHLSQLNNSGDRGDARFELNGDQLTVSLRTYGASPNLPHAQHLHIGGTRHECPTLGNDDTNNDGFISSAEGTPSYGPVQVSLTTSGDVSSKSGLAIDRFPVADANGTVNYRRTFTLPEGVKAEDIKNAVVVQHGISELFNDPAKYDGAMRSTLDASLPFEATVPASCGKLLPLFDSNLGNNGQNNNDNVNNANNGSGGNNANGEPGSNVNISNTGPGSTNKVDISSNSRVDISNTNRVGVSNQNKQSANSGQASSSGNTVGSEVHTGNASNQIRSMLNVLFRN